MGRGWWLAAMILPVLCVGAHAAIMSVLTPTWRDWFISEYGPTEIVTAGLFAACALLAVRMLRRHWLALPTLVRAAYLFFAAGAGFVAVEEISYGQTFWEYHTPEWFQEKNHQREFNLHNLAGDKPSRLMRRVGEIGMPLFGLAIPLLWVRRQRGYDPGTLGYHLFPRFELLGAVLGSIAIRGLWWWRKSLERFPDWTAGLSELQELIWAMAGLVWIVAIRRRFEARAAGAPGAESASPGDLRPGRTADPAV